jgi:two-component system NarL family sensor kinase
MPRARHTGSMVSAMPEPVRLSELEESPELLAILVAHAYRGVRVQVFLRLVLLLFMAATLVFEPPADDVVPCTLIIAWYALWTVGVWVWASRGGVDPIRWIWVALVVDTCVLGVLALVAGISSEQSWTADILGNGLFLIPLLAATQLRPVIAAAVALPATAIYLAVNLVTQHANTEPLSSVLLRTFAIAGLSAACVYLSYVQQSRVLTIAGLATDRSKLLTELVGVEARERTQLAESLHDGALQYVLAARHDLEDARDTGDPTSFDRVEQALAESSALLRSTVTELHPAVLHEAGLERALADLVDRQRGSSCSLDATEWTHGDRRGTPLADELLYGAGRELLANVAKHARAANVVVTLKSWPGEDVLVVADDGVGVAVDTLGSRLAEGHVGLASLRARITGFGGSLALAANHPSGTMVTVTVPNLSDAAIEGGPRR